MKSAYLGWPGIVRLGLVQGVLGAMAAFATSTLNRVMVVEEALPAAMPAAFVAWHYVVQLSRPRWGHGSDLGARRTPWIVGGVGVVCIGLMTATDATTMMASARGLAILLAIVGFSMIGAGVGAAGTSLLALLASRVAPERRPAAASITWMLMIAGIVVCAGASGAALQPFSAQRLAMVASAVAAVGFGVTLFATWRAEGGAAETVEPLAQSSAERPSFKAAIAEMRSDPISRRFTLFIFVSMLAFSAQELILEPFAGLVFHLNPGQSAQLTSIQHGGILLGMILVGVLGARFGDRGSPWMRRWTVLGCAGSASALAVLGAASLSGLPVVLYPTVFLLGLANGVFSVSAIGSMMGLAGSGRRAREGVRMGVWGAAQALAFAVGGFLGAAGVGALRQVFDNPAPAFLLVFGIEALIFLIAAVLAGGLGRPASAGSDAERTGVALELEGVRS